MYYLGVTILYQSTIRTLFIDVNIFSFFSNKNLLYREEIGNKNTCIDF